MRVIVAGSRSALPAQVREAIRACPWSHQITVVVSGTAAGADQEGERWADERGLAVDRFPADWRTYGKSAGPIRNREMAAAADGLVAVWDGASRGTLSMIELARERGLRVFVFRTDSANADDYAARGEVAERWAARTSGDGGRESLDPIGGQSGGAVRSLSRYRLNTLLVSVPPDAKIVGGRQAFHDRDQLRELRDRLRETHLVKRSRDGIECFPYREDGESIGERFEARLARRPDISQNLIREWLARSLARYRVRRGPGGVVEYISERAESNLLNAVLGRTRLPEGIGRRIAADFDVRRIRGSAGDTRLVIAIDVRTRTTIDCPVSELLAIGLNPCGLYVQREVMTTGGVRRKLAGRVRAVRDGFLVLEDNEPDVPDLPASAAWLEARKENLERILRAVARDDAKSIVERLQFRVADRLGGRARLEVVDEWVRAIRKFRDDIGQGVRLRLDASVMRADGGRFPAFELYEKPQLVFDVGLTKVDTWNQGGLERHGPYNFERFAPKRLNIALVCQASRQGDVERFVHQLLDGVPGSKWAGSGFVRRYHLERPFVRTFTARSAAASHYREAVAAAIDDGTSRNERWSLALIQTDESTHDLRGDDNPYLLTKALFLSQQVPTQAFEWESIRPGVPVEATINNLGLAMYAKVNGIPWLLPVHQTVAHELVVGLGSYSASLSRLGGREKYVGVATIFSASGRYFLESRTPATPEEDYLAALLDALERAIGEVRRHEGWQDDHRVRLIFHVFKDFSLREIEAVRRLMQKLNLPHAEFAFLHLVEAHPFMLFDPAQDGIGQRRRKGVAAAPRGLRVDLGANEALLSLKGPKELRQWSDGMPKPMLLRLHPESTFRDLTYLARQVYDFTCLSWRTLFASRLPITVLYADLVAQNLLKLRDVSCWTPETILGPVGRGRWFL